MNAKEYEYYMDLALIEAKKALENNEVPVGAIILDENNNIVSKGYNKKELMNDISSHAEIEAIKMASKKINNWRLDNYTILITLSPCLMCTGAILSSRIKKVIVGALNIYDDNLTLIKDIFFNNNIEFINGVKEKECLEILQNFFKSKRNF